MEVIFSATTSHPNIEATIKDFIRTINSELAACNKFRKFCSSKWQNQPLPREIDTHNLTSDNYQSDDYHFSLSQDKILTLLTGDGLFLITLLGQNSETVYHQIVKKIYYDEISHYLKPFN